MEDEGDDDRPPTLSELNTSPVLKRTQNPNYYLKSMKPVGVDLGLEFHEKLIHKVDHSLKSTKFRLHQTELLLNLEPPLDEVSHHEDWEATIEDLLSDNHRLEFPKFSQIQKQSELNLLLQKQTKEHERAQSRQEWNRRASMILAKETLNLQKKILAGKCQFGGSVKGVPLKTIQNYKGCNTFDRGTRTLVRKDGSRLPPSNEHNLPEWFGPQYYEYDYDPNRKRDSTFQIAFKSPERYHVSAETINRENILRRRKQLATSRSELVVSSVETLDLQKPSTSESQRQQKRFSIISDLDEDEDSQSLEGSLEEDPEQPGQMKRKKNIRRSMNSSVDSNTAEDSSLKSNSTLSLDLSEDAIGKLLEKYDTHITMSSRRQSTRLSKSRRGTNQMNRLSMIALPDPNHQKKQRKKQRQQDPQQKGMTGSRSTILNPLVTHHAYALKILDAADPRKQKGWKPKDYTLDALRYQKPVEYSTVFIEDTFEDPTAPATPSQSTVVPNNPSIASQNSASTAPILKYSSEVFRLKPNSHYKSSDVLLREVDQYVKKKNQKKTNPTQIGQSPPSTPFVPISGTATPLHANLLSGDNLEDAPSPHYHVTTSGNVNILVLENSSLEGSQDTQSRSNSPHPPADHFVAASQKTRLEDDNSLSLTQPANNKLSPPPTGYIPQLHISSKEILFSQPKTGELGDLPSNSLHSATSFTTLLHKWYDEHDIIRYQYKKTGHKPLYPGTRDPKPLSEDQQVMNDDEGDRYRGKRHPSLDLSLKGLLLEENPYLSKEQQAELIKQNQNTDINDIQI